MSVDLRKDYEDMQKELDATSLPIDWDRKWRASAVPLGTGNEPAT